MTLIRTISILVVALLLAGCGADGEPIQPTVSAGVGVSSSGIHTAGAVGLQKGPVGVFFGF